MRILLNAVALVLLALPASAQQGGQPAPGFRVVNVAANDVLNARIGPSVDYDLIASLPPNATGVQIAVCVPTVSPAQFQSLNPSNQARLNAMTPWCLVAWQDRQIGWVNQSYLAPMN